MDPEPDLDPDGRQIQLVTGITIINIQPFF
jgi:hypothetical protein